MTAHAPAGDAREGSILDAFVDLADSLVDDYDPLHFLYRLLDHSIPLTGAAAGAVLLHYEGSLHVVASSDEDVEAVEMLEVQHEQGPAFDSFASGDVVQGPSIAVTSMRWPDVARMGAANGWSAYFAVPLRLRDHVVGAFVVFWPEGSVGPNNDDERMLQGFADVATISVLQQRETAAVERTNLQLHVALSSRTKIEQAKGMIAQASGIRMGEAFTRLRSHARSTRARIADVAAAIIAGELAIDTLSSP